VLAERVRDLSWNRLEAGDLANLDGRGSIFPIGEEDSTLRERSERLDIHPTGPMWGRGAPPSGGRVRELEERIAAGLSPAPELVSAAGMAQERRSLRVSVRDLQWAREGSDVRVQFRLARGSFATTVLRELFDFDTAQGDEDTGS
jgi:tRNA pseudouridine13 synthase